MRNRLNQLGGEDIEGTDSTFYPREEVGMIMQKIDLLLGKASVSGEMVRKRYRTRDSEMMGANEIGIELNAKIIAAFEGKTDAETVTELESIAKEVEDWMADFDETASIVRQIIALRPK